MGNGASIHRSRAHGGNEWVAEGVLTVCGIEEIVPTNVTLVRAVVDLASLEVLVHVDTDKLLQDYVAISVTINRHLVTQVPEPALPNDWRAYPSSKATRTIGDGWVSHGATAVLQVRGLERRSISRICAGLRFPGSVTV